MIVMFSIANVCAETAGSDGVSTEPRPPINTSSGWIARRVAAVVVRDRPVKGMTLRV